MPPTGVELAVLKALEKSISSAVSQVGKRLWLQKLSPSGRRNTKAAAALKRLAAHDLADQLRISRIIPALPVGLSLAKLKRAMEGPAYQGVMHELVAARLLSMQGSTLSNLRENLRLVTRLEFAKEDIPPRSLASFSDVLFVELDHVVSSLTATLENAEPDGLAELRTDAAVTILSSGIDGIRRHNLHLKRLDDPADRCALLDWEDSYRIQVRAAHGYIEPPDFERKRKLPLDSLFVPPSVKRWRDDRDEKTDVSILRDRIDRTVLLGSPGGGKSTSANFIAWQAADDSSDVVPFVVTLRRIADRDMSIVDHIERMLDGHYQCRAPSHAVEGILLSGKALVIFDGLDELVDTTWRRAMADRVELFCARYPLARVLVTSRKVGYEEAALDHQTFQVYELSEFSDENVEKYVRKWFEYVEGEDSSSAVALSGAFFAESSGVPDLRSNPLMLALMCIIYRGQGWIPRNRPDVYESCARLLFEKWDSSRQIYVELQAGDYVDSAIKHLALWMFQQPANVDGVREAALIEEASILLEPAFTSRTQARRAAREFVEFCRGRAWVLTDTGTTAEGERLFSFTHRTFLEYFAAYEFTRVHDSPEEMSRSLLPRIAAAEWGNVAELVVQITDKNSRGGAARMLEHMILNRRFKRTASRQNICNFAFRCLSFAHVPASTARKIARSYILAAVAHAVGSPPMQTELCRAGRNLLDSIVEEVGAVLTELLNGESDDMRRVAIELVFVLPDEMSSLRPGGDNVEGRLLWENLKRDLLAAHRDLILQSKDPVIWFAAWRDDLISLKDLLISGPRIDQRFPLGVLYKSNLFTYIRRGWGDWGSFMPERLLQSGADQIPNFPASREELQWLLSFLNSLPGPPWVDDVADVLWGGFFDGEFTAEKLSNDAGWALFVLMLVAIEAQGIGERGEVVELGEEDKSFYRVATCIGLRRASGRPLPVWLADVFQSLDDVKAELLEGWFAGKISFTTGKRSTPRRPGLGGLPGVESDLFA